MQRTSTPTLTAVSPPPPQPRPIINECNRPLTDHAKAVDVRGAGQLAAQQLGCGVAGRAKVGGFKVRLLRAQDTAQPEIADLLGGIGSRIKFGFPGTPSGLLVLPCAQETLRPQSPT